MKWYRRILNIVVLTCLFIASAQAGSLKWSTEKAELILEPTESVKETTFKFSNNGKKAVTVVGVKTSCGCTVAEMEKKSFAPGESGELKVTYKKPPEGTSGTKSILVVTDESNDNFYNLTVLANHKQAATIEPFFTTWHINEPAAVKTITVKLVSPYKFNITDVGVTNENFEVTLHTIKPKQEYQISVKPRDASFKSSSTLRLYTDDKNIPVLYARATVQ